MVEDMGVMHSMLDTAVCVVETVLKHGSYRLFAAFTRYPEQINVMCQHMTWQMAAETEPHRLYIYNVRGTLSVDRRWWVGCT